MEFIKKNMQWIAFGLIAAAAIGLGIWGILGSSEVQAKMETVSKLTGTARGLGQDPVNKKKVEDKAKAVEQRKKESEQIEDIALGVQKFNAFYETGDGKPVPRTPLVDKALPLPVGSADAISFRDAYIREFDHLKDRLHAIEVPIGDDIQAEQMKLDQEKKNPAADVKPLPWDIFRIFTVPERKDESGRRTRLDILRDNAGSRVAYLRATQGWVYCDAAAFGRHKLATSTSNPTAVEIWQAQMSLWIQQDIVTALGRANEKRAAELTQANRKDDIWVAHMPVKHIQRVSLANNLGGTGSGSNHETTVFSGVNGSMTNRTNNSDMFIVPVQLQLIIEEAALSQVIEEMCSVGFYTPLSVFYQSVSPNPVQDKAVYGDDPIIKVQLDFEGYFFHVVFGQWIPKELQDILKKPYIEGGDVSPTGGGRAGRRDR